MSCGSNNLYVAESSFLFNPLQLQQQGAQVPDIHPSPMQRRSQGSAIHRDLHVVQEVLQLAKTHGLHQGRSHHHHCYNLGLI